MIVYDVDKQEEFVVCDLCGKTIPYTNADDCGGLDLCEECIKQNAFDSQN